MNSRIKKLGTIDCDLVESTPVIFNNELYRFEYVRHNTTGNTYFRFVNVKTGKPTESFAVGYHLGSAYSENGIVYAFAVDKWGGDKIWMFKSNDMKAYTSQCVIQKPGWGIYNTSVCKGAGGRYIMAIELGEPPEDVGVRFTMRFAESTDIVNWKILPADCVFLKERYTACPAIRFLDDGYYYMIFLGQPIPDEYKFKPEITRTKDFVHWELSPYNPIMSYDDEDKKIKNTSFTAEQREYIKNAVNINDSDIDLCEFEGKVVIYYSWGSQAGNEFLAEAVFDGTLKQFLQGYF